MSCLDNKALMQLAVQNFEFQQSIYIQELEELKGWSKKWRLSEMGFGREKTVYTYFAIASCSCLPYNSIMRLVIAKAAIIVTVADDFYDMEGSLHELEILTDAIKRWDGEGLKGHSKTSFDALDDFVNDIVAKSESQQPGATLNLQEIWRETFASWMVERRWSLAGHIPSMDEYFATGCISTATHTIALPATNFLNQNSSTAPLDHPNITKLLMAIACLANDIQSYQKEEVDGKMNPVLLHSHQHPNLRIEGSITYVKQILEMKRKEFLELVFMDTGFEDMPTSCKKMHLYCMKVFQMFFNSANLFDSETALLDDIKKSIYLLIRHTKSKPDPNFMNPIPDSVIPNPKVEKKKKSSDTFKISSRFRPISTSFVKQSNISSSYVAVREKLHVHMKFNSSFIGLPM